MDSNTAPKKYNFQLCNNKKIGSLHDRDSKELAINSCRVGDSNIVLNPVEGSTLSFRQEKKQMLELHIGNPKMYYIEEV